MRILIHSVILAAALLTGGCAERLSPPDDLTIVLPSGTAIYRVRSDDGVRMLQQDDVRRTKTGVIVPAGVAMDGPVKAYPIARYVDPYDPTTVHERHVIYRNEMPPRWLLDVGREDQIIIGPTVGRRPVSLHPAVVGAEIAAELPKTREATGLMLSATEDAMKSNADLIASLEASNARAEDLLRQAKSIDARRKTAETRAANLETENKALKEPKKYTGDDDE